MLCDPRLSPCVVRTVCWRWQLVPCAAPGPRGPASAEYFPVSVPQRNQIV